MDRLPGNGMKYLEQNLIFSLCLTARDRSFDIWEKAPKKGWLSRIFQSYLQFKSPFKIQLFVPEIKSENTLGYGSLFFPLKIIVNRLVLSFHNCCMEEPALCVPMIKRWTAASKTAYLINKFKLSLHIRLEYGRNISLGTFGWHELGTLNCYELTGECSI